MKFFMRILSGTNKTPMRELENPMVKYLNSKCLVAATATILLVSGCSSNNKPNTSENAAMSSTPDVARTERLEDVQMNSGARFESTLYIDQFDGAGLSSLGTESLDRILADSHSCNPLVIYMDVPEDDNAQARREAVGRYLEDKGGLKTEQIEFRSGTNPSVQHLTAPDIINYSKTDTGSSATGSSSGSGH